MKIRFHLLLLILLCLAFILTTIKSYASTISKDLQNNFFRLHILANSDSDIDQELKLRVRDAILEYMDTLCYNDISKDEAIEITNNNLNKFKSIAENVIKSYGFNYPVNLEIGSFYFPTKKYGNISLPAGYYDGLKIEIGNAKGQNWWCSLFPPLCFVDISSGIIDDELTYNLKENLSSEEFAIVTNNSTPIKVKFKLVELLSK